MGSIAKGKLASDALVVAEAAPADAAAVAATAETAAPVEMVGKGEP